ncbi:GLPGLI family protein [uncultured Duncaniella sp.]|uniref:GLPGLI family protein n=1 Tax=uncultured Duncaniella sp. TaxID=2768039 RepID=UPI0025B43618|nr:GLPGLI family protein [uncultured Duncaniella sp.]
MKFILLICAALVAVSALKSETKPNVYLKVQYQTSSLSTNRADGEMISNSGNYILQVAGKLSYYYDPQTYYIDSLENDPVGSQICRQAWTDAFEEFSRTGAKPFEILGEKGFLRKGAYKALKDFNFGKITVWDTAGGDKFRYDVDMEELSWEIGDSIKNVLGYECQSATADYHGRKWTAWFAPDVAVQDGPWQLCGLPGLIMEATTSDGEYGFIVTGLQKCDEALKEPFEDDKYFKSTRKLMLKAKAYSRDNRSQFISGLTGGNVNINDPKFKEKVDYIETDYAE